MKGLKANPDVENSPAHTWAGSWHWHPWVSPVRPHPETPVSVCCSAGKTCRVNNMLTAPAHTLTAAV